MANMDLQQLKDAIAALEREGLQKQFDEGARLHAEKNAPSVSGMYADLKFPPYQFREFPKMLYKPDYMAACEQFDGACRYRERRDEPGERDRLMTLAQRRKDEACCIVKSADEEEKMRGRGEGWSVSPTAAVEWQRKLDAEIAEAAAVSNFDDRRMGELAKREREAADDASDGHLVEVAEQRRGPGRPRKDAS